MALSSLVWILAMGEASARPVAQVSGLCPGEMTVEVRRLVAGGKAAVLGGSGLGNAVVPAGDCAGRVTELAGMKLVGVLEDTDGNERETLRVQVPERYCGGVLQVLDLTSCELSEVDPVTCIPTGTRAPLNTLTQRTGAGCWDGNPCARNAYFWDSANGQSFGADQQRITCSGPPSCVQNVGITTFDRSSNCQGAWDVYCDTVWVGRIDTVGRACADTAMTNGCMVSLPFPLACADLTLEAVETGNEPRSCCSLGRPDSIITAVSAW